MFSIYDNQEVNASESTIKYLITIKFDIDGIVESSDVIGAIFGQTEGLLGDTLDLRDLQKSQRIGRISVKIQYDKKKRRTTGAVVVPSSLDRIETAILAASLETVDRVGPCTADIKLSLIEDIRKTKREKIVERATEILSGWERDISAESASIIDEVSKSSKVAKIVKYGRDKLPAGPAIDESDSILIVEGRADVLNLLNFGFRNVIACNGTKIPKTITKLCQQKVAIAFVDGDRGGSLVLQELQQVAKIDYATRAPKGLEVEQLNGKQILKALKNKIPGDQIHVLLDESDDRRYHDTSRVSSTQKIEPDTKGSRVVTLKRRKPQTSVKPQIDDSRDSRTRRTERKPLFRKSTRPHRERESKPKPIEIPSKIKDLFKKSTGKALLIGDGYDIKKKMEITELVANLPKEEKLVGIVLDGVVTQRLLDIAASKKIEFILGAVSGEITRKPTNVKIYAIA